jgi:hypothetical protein
MAREVLHTADSETSCPLMHIKMQMNRPVHIAMGRLKMRTYLLAVGMEVQSTIAREARSEALQEV